MVFNLYYLLFANLFCLLDPQKIAKKRRIRFKLDLSLYFAFWYDLVNVYAYVLHPYLDNLLVFV